MKQSFVNINSFTSQKKIVIFCFCFTKLEKKKTNRQRKVFKSLVICNYASKKSYNKSYKYAVKQNEQRTQTRAFFVSVWRSSHLFFRESVGEKFVQQQQQCDIYGFFVFVSLEEGLPDRQQHQQVSSADWFHFLFEIFRLSHTMFTHKNRLFQNVKRKILKKKPNCIILRLCVPSNTKN